MDLNNIRQLFDYNRWAGHRALAAASTLATDDFLRPMGNSFSSVRDTLAHILGAEWVWLERWQGRSPKALLDPAVFPTVQSLESRWEIVEREQMQFIEGAHPTAPARRAGLHKPERPALFLSALAAAGSRSQPFQLPSRPDHNSVASTRR